MVWANSGVILTLGEEQEPAWKIRDGRLIAVSEMDDQHLRNTIRMLQRWHEKYVNIDYYTPAADNNGPEISLNCPVYTRLLEEALRRGLQVRCPHETEEMAMTEFHVQVVRIGEILPHPNADRLQITRVHGGYPVVIGKENFKTGDLAVYVPVDTVLPETDAFAFLTESERRRLRAKKLRGIFSMGLLVPAPEGVEEGEDVAELMGVRRWEAPIDMQIGGECEPAPQGWSFPHYTDIEGLRRNHGLLVQGEEVIITEKIHGTNARYVHDGTRLWVGSHNQIKREDPAVIWWRVAHELELSERLAVEPMRVFFGEVFGQVQDLRYGHEGRNTASLRIFDVFDIREGRYLDQVEAENAARLVGLQWVPTLFRGSWDPELAVDLAEGRTTIPGADNVREGFVVKPIRERYDDRVGRVILKMHGQGYLLRKQKK